DGKIVGMASLSLRWQLGLGGLLACLDELAVAPGFKGAERVLLQATVGKARSLGARRVVTKANEGTPPPRAAQLRAAAAAAAPPAAAVVCHAHPLQGGVMHFKVVFRAAKALQAESVAALRFNFRGVGRSEGRHDEGRGEQDDVRAALDELSRRFPGLPLLTG